jgi:hypothetical protein
VVALRDWMGQEDWRQVTEGDAFPARQEQRRVA